MLGGWQQIPVCVPKLGRFIIWMTFPTIPGFLSGIGFIFIIVQFAPVLGQTNPPGGPLAALLNVPVLLVDPVGDAVAVGANSRPATRSSMRAALNRIGPDRENLPYSRAPSQLRRQVAHSSSSVVQPA